MIHVGCGGAIVPDETILYDYETDEGTKCYAPAYRCTKCGVEVLGDAQIELVVT